MTSSSRCTPRSRSPRRASLRQRHPRRRGHRLLPDVFYQAPLRAITTSTASVPASARSALPKRCRSCARRSRAPSSARRRLRRTAAALREAGDRASQRRRDRRRPECDVGLRHDHRPRGRGDRRRPYRHGRGAQRADEPTGFPFAISPGDGAMAFAAAELPSSYSYKEYQMLSRNTRRASSPTCG